MIWFSMETRSSANGYALLFFRGVPKLRTPLEIGWNLMSDHSIGLAAEAFSLDCGEDSGTS